MGDLRPGDMIQIAFDPKDVETQFAALREEYRRKMNGESDLAARAAQQEDWGSVSEHSTASERYREAFHALNRAATIMYPLFDNAADAQSKEAIDG